MDYGLMNNNRKVYLCSCRLCVWYYVTGERHNNTDEVMVTPRGQKIVIPIKKRVIFSHFQPYISKGYTYWTLVKTNWDYYKKEKNQKRAVEHDRRHNMT